MPQVILEFTDREIRDLLIDAVKKSNVGGYVHAAECKITLWTPDTAILKDGLLTTVKAKVLVFPSEE